MNYGGLVNQHPQHILATESLTYTWWKVQTGERECFYNMTYLCNYLWTHIEQRFNCKQLITFYKSIYINHLNWYLFVIISVWKITRKEKSSYFGYIVKLAIPRRININLVPFKCQRQTDICFLYKCCNQHTNLITTHFMTSANLEPICSNKTRIQICIYLIWFCSCSQ